MAQVQDARCGFCAFCAHVPHAQAPSCVEVACVAQAPHPHPETCPALIVAAEREERSRSAEAAVMDWTSAACTAVSATISRARMERNIA